MDIGQTCAEVRQELDMENHAEEMEFEDFVGLHLQILQSFCEVPP